MKFHMHQSALSKFQRYIIHRVMIRKYNGYKYNFQKFHAVIHIIRYNIYTIVNLFLNANERIFFYHPFSSRYSISILNDFIYTWCIDEFEVKSIYVETKRELGNLLFIKQCCPMFIDN